MHSDLGDDVAGLTTDIIAVRAAIGWAAGLIGTGLIGGYLASLPNGPRSGWVVIPILATRIPLLLGPAGVGLIVGRLTSGLVEIAAYSAIGVSVVASMWLSAIAAQFAQNIACRLFGARQAPIRWWSGDTGKRSRRRKRQPSQKKGTVR